MVSDSYWCIVLVTSVWSQTVTGVLCYLLVTGVLCYLLVYGVRQLLVYCVIY